MHQAYLSLGGNQGNRFEYIKSAVEIIHKKLGAVVCISDIYKTEPWSYKDKEYLNCAVELRTNLSVFSLLKKSQEIELFLGRVSKTKYDNGKPKYFERPIDIDILFFDDEIIHTKNLIVPHKLLHLRNFVLKPMIQIAPDFIHPVFSKRIDVLYKNCEDTSFVTLFKIVKTDGFKLQKPTM